MGKAQIRTRGSYQPSHRDGLHVSDFLVLARLRKAQEYCPVNKRHMQADEVLPPPSALAPYPGSG